MPIAETVTIDASQFPENARQELVESLRARVIPSKFHYESAKQAQKWLALHEAYSPARRDPECVAIYEKAFAATAAGIDAGGARVVGLGCGGGQKEARLVELLAARKVPLSYLPCDGSVPLVLTALRAAEAVAPGICVDPLVCDLGRCRSLAESIDRVGGQTGIPRRRIFTFFGVAPNMEPERAGELLGGLLRAEDWLLLSANLAPGEDYAAGVKRVFGGYDNALTREWLLTFLLDAGFERGDGEILFAVEDAHGGFKRIAADYYLTKAREIEVYGERFAFAAGERIRLFFSYRYQPQQAEILLRRHGLETVERWVTGSGEEGVFMCRRRQ